MKEIKNKNTKKCAVLIDERTSIPYCVFVSKKYLKEKVLKEKVTNWIRSYIINNHYIANPFRMVIMKEELVSKKYRRINIDI